MKLKLNPFVLAAAIQPQEKFMTPAVSHRSAAPCLLAALLVFGAAPSSAAVSPVGIGAFGAGSLLIDFNAPGLFDTQEVNGLSTGGLGFSFSLGNELVSLSVVPGPTSNTTPLNMVSDIGISNAGVLTVTLPELSSLFGFGYAILATNVGNASVTVTLFNGASNVGALSFTALPDPLVPPFFGGFAGLQSTLPFNRTELRFSGAQAWAADDLRVTPVPEPSQWALLLAGVAILGGLAQRRNGRT
jgi:hypothetical protein